MPASSPTHLAYAWWQAIDRADFAAAVRLMAPGAVVDWPLSNERMASPIMWQQVNEHYPGRWAATVRSVVAENDMVVTVTDISDGSITVVAISFFTIQKGRISSSTGPSPTPRLKAGPSGPFRSRQPGPIEGEGKTRAMHHLSEAA
ncbi:MAG: nuclear transport factor 2 family protein [Chloroflexota bacterium]|nr:nuclear transport factor 2 family protein [Chloroflexota bacterium]